MKIDLQKKWGKKKKSEFLHDFWEKSHNRRPRGDSQRLLKKILGRESPSREGRGKTKTVRSKRLIERSGSITVTKNQCETHHTGKELQRSISDLIYSLIFTRM